MFSLYMRILVLGCGLFALTTQGTHAPVVIALVYRRQFHNNSGGTQPHAILAAVVFSYVRYTHTAFAPVPLQAF